MGPPTATLVWDDRFRAYDFGPEHPFTETSRWLAVRLLESGWAERPGGPGLARIARIEPAARPTLERFHAPEYLDLVERLDRRGKRELLDRGDTPSFPGCYEAAARIVGGTVTATRSVRAGPTHRALQPGGGLHHAHAGSASGFCILNDVAVAIADALHEGVRRVAYVDIDVHQGDGVMYGFYRDGRVLDIDVHETGRSIFPGTGEVHETGAGDGAGLKVNVPLPPGAGDAEFESVFLRLVPPMLDSFRPELIVLQGGLDAHAGDGLGHLRYSMRSYEIAARTLRELTREVGAAGLVVTGGGGYAPSNVARGLALYGAVLLSDGDRLEVGDALPEAWRREFEAATGAGAPRTLSDPPVPNPAGRPTGDTDRLIGELERHLGRRFPAVAPG